MLPRPSAWRREELRSSLWFVPTIEVAAAVILFVSTFAIDRAANHGDLTLPTWVDQGSADAARQVLTGVVAAIITVVGLVFSITIVALTLASTQFGPRMLRNFVRDPGTQLTVGTFVASFIYTLLTLGSISHDGADFVPHLSITIALGLTLVDLGVLIYFIHDITKSIQLPNVVASIARDLTRELAADRRRADVAAPPASGPSIEELRAQLDAEGAVVVAPRSGYVQYVEEGALVALAKREGAVIRLLHRPGHFIVEGLPMADVLPPSAAPAVAAQLRRSHVAGPQRTLSQDNAFAIDQLVEIAIRALSPAVNDTFTALTCIDWLADGLCQIERHWRPVEGHRDGDGMLRLLRAPITYRRFVDRSFDQVRQAGRGIPAVLIRQLDALRAVALQATTDAHVGVLSEQAELVLSTSEESVVEAADRADVRVSYDKFRAAIAQPRPS